MYYFQDVKITYKKKTMPHQTWSSKTKITLINTIGN